MLILIRRNYSPISPVRKYGHLSISTFLPDNVDCRDRPAGDLNQIGLVDGLRGSL